MKKLASVLAFSLLSSGCVEAPPLGYSPVVQDWPTASASSSAPSISVYCSNVAPNQVYQVPTCPAPYMKVLEESRQFSKILNSAAGGDYRVDLAISQYGDTPSPWGILGSACTLYIAPFSVTSYMNLSTTVTDAKGRVVDKTFFTEAYTMKIGLFGQLLPPDLGMGNLIKTTLAELARRGTWAPASS